MEELIIRSLQQRTTPEEEGWIRSWREGGWENEQRYTTLAELWSLVGVAGSVREVEAPADVDLIVALAERRARPLGAWEQEQSVLATAGARPSSGWGPRWRHGARVGALAASLVLGLGLGLFSNALTGRKEAPAHNEVTTGADESATVTFSDNTVVRLGPRSTLRLIEAGEDPVVWLEGRAFFGVVPDPSRTFTVRTQYGDAIALGTRFEVRTDEREFRVLVIQGNVRVSSAGRSVELGEGLMSRNVPGGAPITSRVEDVNEQLDWLGQTLVFRATPLSRVISEIEHRYGVRGELEDRSLSDLTVTAAFTDQPIDSVLFVVCEIVGAACTVQDGRFRIGDPSLSPSRPGMRPAGGSGTRDF